MRRIRRILLIFLAVIVVVVLTSPLWMAMPLRWVLEGQDITFADYQTNGYTRFVLTDLQVKKPGIEVTVKRAEADTPIVLLWRRIFSSPGVVKVDGWKLTTLPDNEPPPPADPVNELPAVGVMPLRHTIEDVLQAIAPWVPELQASNGEIIPDPTGKNTAQIPSLVYTGSKATTKVTIPTLSYGDYQADVALTWVIPSESITLKVTGIKSTKPVETPSPAEFKQPPLESQIQLVFQKNELTGDIYFRGQTAKLTAKFDHSGWLPLEASLDAPNLAIPGDDFGLGGTYQQATGKIAVAYRDQKLAADIVLRAEPQSGTSNPPLDVVLHAQGNPDTVHIDTFDITLPGAKAHLSAPITFTRQLQLLSGKSQFVIEADLARQPWVPIKGRIKGEITLIPHPDAVVSAIPHIDANLHATDIRYGDQLLSTAEIVLTQENTLTRLTSLKAAFADESTIEGSGQYNAETDLLSNTRLHAQLKPTALPWLLSKLPDGASFAKATLDINLDGPIHEPSHTGTVALEKVQLPPLFPKGPAEINAKWQGRALIADAVEVSATSAASTLSLTCSLGIDSALLQTLQLRREDQTLLSLEAPARISWVPNLNIAPLKLSGPAMSNDSPAPAISAQFAYSDAAVFAFTAGNIDSSLLGEIVNVGPAHWHIDSASASGGWTAASAPLTGKLTVSARIDVAQAAARENSFASTATFYASANLDTNGVSIEQLSVSENNAPVAYVTGKLPLTIHPGQAPNIRLAPDAPMSFDAHTEPASGFWKSLADATGIILESPRVNARVAGTSKSPSASADVAITRIAFDPARWPATIPPLTNINARLTTNVRSLDLETFSMEAAGQSIQASAQIPLPASNTDELFSITPTQLVEQLERSRVHISIPGAELSALVPYMGNVLAPRGQFALEINLTPGQTLRGTLQLRDAATRPMAPLGSIGSINAEARVDGRRLEISSASALVGSQPAKLSGHVEFASIRALFASDKTPTVTDLDLQVKADNIPFVRTPGLLLRGDINLQAKSKGEDPARIQGTVTLRDSLFLADLRALWGPSTASGPSSRPPFFAVETPPLNTWQLDIAVKGHRFLNIHTTVFDGTLSADFKITGPLGDPRAIGAATIDSGKVMFPFTNFTAQNGTLRLTQASPFVPAIEFAAEARQFGYDLRMEIHGTVAAPQLTFSSSPALTSEQILLLVMAGEAPRDEIETTNQQRAINVGSYLGLSFVEELLGMSPSEGRLSISSGEKITRQGRETYNIEYKLADRWSAVGEYDQFDAYNIGVKWNFYTSKPPEEKPEEKEESTEKSK